MPMDELKRYKPDRGEPADFDNFWQRSIEEARKHPLEAVFSPADCGITEFETYDVTYSGYGGQRIKGWFMHPKRQGNFPCVVEFIGYGGGRGLPMDWLTFPAAGYAHFVMDTRGQGSSWRNGDTPDPEPDGSSPHYPGFMTKGILDPKAYYYRRVYIDAVRAIEAARSHERVNPDRIALNGGSQGGGITIAAAGLVPDVAAAMPDVPFLCNFKRATSITDSYPYQEIVKFCSNQRQHVDQVFETLNYFEARALFSVAQMDGTCPPSTVYAAYNWWKGKKEIRSYPFNNHEGGQTYQTVEKVNFLRELFG